MLNSYDKSLHAPLPWKTMESSSCDFDEQSIDSAISDVLHQDEDAQSPDAKVVLKEQVEFPELQSACEPEPEQKVSVAELFRQKWAAFAATALVVVIVLGNLPTS